MINKLIKLADLLDEYSLDKEADCLEIMIKKYSAYTDQNTTQPGASSLTWIDNYDEWGTKMNLGRKNEIVPLNENGRPMMADRDMAAMQRVLDQDSRSAMGYFVMDPYNDEDWEKYVVGEESHPEGKEIAVPLSTYEVDGKRINFFKINVKGSADWFGRVEEGVGTEGPLAEGDLK